MLNANQKLFLRVIEKTAEQLPVTHRIKFYRGAVDLLRDRALVKLFTKKAEALEKAERECLELDLKFNGAPSGDGHGGAK